MRQEKIRFDIEEQKIIKLRTVMKKTIQLDPRTKIAILILVNIIVLSPLDFGLEVLLTGLISLTMLYAGKPADAAKCVIQYIAILLLYMLVLKLPGTLAATFSVLFVVARKMFPVLMCAKILLYSRAGELIEGMQKIHITKKIVIALTIVLRFFPTIKEEFSCIREAMKIRGIALNVKNVLLHPAATTQYILVPMIQRLSVVSEELSAAAIARGIDSETKRTSYYQVRFGAQDALFLCLYLLLAVIIWLKRLGVI